MDSFLQDLRLGLKLLWKDKAYTLTALLTLALTIGANVAIFTVVSSVLLRPLPVPEADRIVLMQNLYPRAGVGERGSTGVSDYYDRLRETDCFEEQALYRYRGRALGEGSTPERLRGMEVTPSFLRLLDAEPRLGRNFTEDEGELGNENRVILSHALWQQLGGESDVLGREMVVDGETFEVVGVMPEGFFFVDPEVRLWTPLAFTDEQKQARHSNNYTMIARLAPGASLEQAQQQIDALNQRNLDRFPQFKELLINAGFHTLLSSFQDDLVRDVRGSLYLLWGGAFFVLLIGCVNLANLALVRSNVRLKELVTRFALGAGRSRVIRQVLTESMLLTVTGGVLGLACGYWSLGALRVLGMDQIPRGAEIGMDVSVVLVALGLALGVGIVIGVIPVVGVFGVDPSSVLREEGRSGTSGRGTQLVRRGLVTAQVAIALVLLMGAGLLFASFRQVLSVDPGFRPDGLLTAWVSLPGSRYEDDADRRAFAARSVERIRALPGVVQAGATNVLPFGGGYSDSVILAEGYVMEEGESLISPNQANVTADYFQTMGIPLVEGRFFDRRDGADSPRVIIVDERLAKRFWGDESPVGRRMFQPGSAEDLVTPNEETEWLTVVGVVGDIKLRGLAEADDRVGAYYLPFTQRSWSGVSFVIRTATDPKSLIPSLRREIAEIDPQLPVFDARTMVERMDRSLVSRRSPMVLTLGFGAVALFLASLGLYGVLAYLVTRRTKEIGIRMALGSSGGRIFRLVVSEGLAILAVGLALGLAGAFALRRALESQLYGVTASDPLVLAAVVGLLVLVSLLACLLPAARATRIHPVVALSE